MTRLRKIFFYARNFRFGPRKSARALIIHDGRLLTFRRKRFAGNSGEWIEYYSIPGGGIDPGETPEQAVVRELREEMGVEITRGPLVAHRYSKGYEHYVFSATIVSGEPLLMADSEEALYYMNEYNQYTVEWVPVSDLTVENLRYYSSYLELIQRLAHGEYPKAPLEIRD
jgi:8-oxo-dGTP diphosphatase